MAYFVLAQKRDGVLENVKVGGFKNMAKAYARFRKYATSEIKVYTANGLRTIAARINNQEIM